MKKIQIRQGVFETNSSSTHSICIARNETPDIPQSLHFEYGEFGWGEDSYYDTNRKASYLYTGLMANEMQDEFSTVISILESKGVVVTIEDVEWGEFKSGEKYATNTGYVDHSNELVPFLKDVCSDEGKLLRFLFTTKSFILTGNDNSDSTPSIDVDYPYEEYYKGN
jgi:hypothetical protein